AIYRSSHASPVRADDCPSDFAYDAEADARIRGVGIAAQPPCRAGLRRRTGPRTTPHHPRPAARLAPGPAVGGRAPVAVLPAVGHPPADIARHIVKAECIGPVRAHRRRTPRAIVESLERVAPLPATGRGVAATGEVAGPLRRRAITPGKAALAAGAEHVLELGLGRQP